jgi:hypothetical protein
MGSLLGVLNQRVAEFSFSTPSAPPSTYTFKLIRSQSDGVPLQLLDLTVVENLLDPMIDITRRTE